MPTLQEIKNFLDTPKLKAFLAGLYGQDEKTVRHQGERFRSLLARYQLSFGDGVIKLFSTPGRI